jgi:hypothetical protein
MANPAQAVVELVVAEKQAEDLQLLPNGLNFQQQAHPTVTTFSLTQCR